VAKLKEEFADYNLTFSIGGQISFDLFPQGWDKTFCLKYLAEADFDGACRRRPARCPAPPVSLPAPGATSAAVARASAASPPPPPPLLTMRVVRAAHTPARPKRAEIHFFGDKTFEGGNDFEIYSHPRTVGHAIEDANPLTTLKKLSELFGVECPAPQLVERAACPA
jgi:phosphomannomutase